MEPCGACGSKITQNDIFCMQCGMAVPNAMVHITPKIKLHNIINPPNKNNYYDPNDVPVYPRFNFRGIQLSVEEAEEFMAEHKDMTNGEKRQLMTAVRPANAQTKVLDNDLDPEEYLELITKPDIATRRGPKPTKTTIYGDDIPPQKPEPRLTNIYGNSKVSLSRRIINNRHIGLSTVFVISMFLLGSTV